MQGTWWYAINTGSTGGTDIRYGEENASRSHQDTTAARECGGKEMRQEMHLKESELSLRWNAGVSSGRYVTVHHLVCCHGSDRCTIYCRAKSLGRFLSTHGPSACAGQSARSAHSFDCKKGKCLTQLVFQVS